MNRALILGVAVFLAVVGIGLMGVDNTASAGGCHGWFGGHGGWGCHGCHGCHGDHACHGGWGCHGLLSGLFGCHGNHCCGCHGYDHGCCGCHGEVEGVEPEVVEEAPAANRTYKRRPFGLRKVSFVR